MKETILNEFIEQVIEIDKPQKIRLKRRIRKSLSKEDPEYINGYWEDEYTGDVYKFDFRSNVYSIVFKVR